MSNRGFGVEIEFNARGIGVEGVSNILDSKGIDSDIYGEDFSIWNIDEDGSEIELRSPILSGKSGFEELKKVMEALKSYGCYATDRDGLHVHHDAPEFQSDFNLVKLLVKSWIQNQEAIKEFVSPYRHGGYWACPEWTDQMFEALNQTDDFQVNQWGETELTWTDETGYVRGFSRNNLNIMSLAKYGSIEIRQHEGTLDYETAEAWIKFGQKFIDSCVKRRNPIPDVAGAENLLKRIRVTSGVNKEMLKKKARILRQRGY